MAIFLCKPPSNITTLEGIECVSYPDVTLYHGSKHKIGEYGAPLNARYPGAKQWSARRLWGDARHWCMRRLPDETYLLYVESEDSFRHREAERAAKKRNDKNRQVSRERDAPYATVEEFRDMLCLHAGMHVDALLLAGSGNMKMWLSQQGRQEIVRLGEQLKQALSRADIVTSENDVPSRPALRLVVNNVAQAEE